MIAAVCDYSKDENAQFTSVNEQVSAKRCIKMLNQIIYLPGSERYR